MTARFKNILQHEGASGAARIGPGLLLSILVAAAAALAAGFMPAWLPIPATVLALLIGMPFHALAVQPLFQPGVTFCFKILLRWAVALLGLRIALSDIAALGLGVAAMVILAMALTILSGFALARFFKQPAAYGAIAGSATAVCGASAALATATVVPAYRNRDADIVFVVVAVNALSTIAMILYPLLCAALGLEDHTAGVLLGATIHDVAQVVGAGYAVSETAGNTAVIVKLFRVLLLVPIVLILRAGFARHPQASIQAESRKSDENGRATGDPAKVPVPVFALVFLALCFLNSAMPAEGFVGSLYAVIKPWLVQASTAGLLIAIAALGLGTSLARIAQLGWRHMATVAGPTLLLLVMMTAMLLVAR